MKNFTWEEMQSQNKALKGLKPKGDEQEFNARDLGIIRGKGLWAKKSLHNVGWNFLDSHPEFPAEKVVVDGKQFIQMKISVMVD